MKLYYMGLDVHKKTIFFCVKDGSGKVLFSGRIPSTRGGIDELLNGMGYAWVGAMESTMFTGWIYDYFLKCGHQLKVADPAMIRWIAKSKKKNDRVDAAKIADLLRCDLLPELVMIPPELRELRSILRFRAMMVQLEVKMKNRTSGLLMESGIEYDAARLHGKRYFRELLDEIDDEAPESVIGLLGVARTAVEYFDEGQRRMIRELAAHPLLKDRIERLMSIDGVGVITALTWALEIGDPHRFGRVRQAVSYCGLCSAQKESGDKSSRGPLSKQRNSYLQTTLIEAAKLAPRYNKALKEVYERELQKGNRNRATLAVARKLVAYMLNIDKNNTEFRPVENLNSMPVLA